MHLLLCHCHYPSARLCISCLWIKMDCMSMSSCIFSYFILFHLADLDTLSSWFLSLFISNFIFLIGQWHITTFMMRPLLTQHRTHFWWHPCTFYNMRQNRNSRSMGKTTGCFSWWKSRSFTKQLFLVFCLIQASKTLSWLDIVQRFVGSTRVLSLFLRQGWWKSEYPLALNSFPLGNY